MIKLLKLVFLCYIIKCVCSLQITRMDFSSHNPLSSNSLSLAARKNDVSNVRHLLKKINPNCVDNRGWTCLHEAANSDSYKSLKVILKHPDCRPLTETHEGHTALYLACRNRCSVKTVKILLESVEGISNICSTEGVSPLHVVSEQGRVEIIQLLIDHGAVLDAQDFDGDTPLHEACLAKQPEAIKVLLKAGANPQIQNEQLFTPFHLACAGPNLKAVSNLISYVKDVNQRIATGDTPLMVALRGNNDAIIYFLLEHGADPNLKNHDGKLALDIALDIGYSSVFKKLLSVTSHDVMNENIVSRACKPHYFTFDILEALLISNLGSKFFEFVEPCQESTETVDELKPFYYTHAPLNAYLNIAEYIYTTSKEKFREYFYLFLKRGVSVNAVDPEEFPPLAYIHYCNHTKCVNEVFDILIEHGCNVDYNSKDEKMPRITDAFLASLTFNPFTTLFMIPYSLYCDPGTLIEVAANNGILDRMPLQVQKKLLNKIDSEHEMTILEYRTNYVPPLKHISRLKVRDIIKIKDGTVKTTQQFLDILNGLPIPQVIKSYVRFS